jgi:putative sigma-54 modulation protein
MVEKKRRLSPRHDLSARRCHGVVTNFRPSKTITAGGVVAVQTKISVRHGHLSEAHQEQVRDKAEKLLHYFNRLTMIEVTVDLKDETRKEVEFRAKAEHKHEFVAREGHAELMAAVDLALDKVVHQIHRYKEKIQDHRRNHGTGDVARTPRQESDSEE